MNPDDPNYRQNDAARSFDEGLEEALTSFQAAPAEPAAETKVSSYFDRVGSLPSDEVLALQSGDPVKAAQLLREHQVRHSMRKLAQKRPRFIDNFLSRSTNHG